MRGCERLVEAGCRRPSVAAQVVAVRPKAASGGTGGRPVGNDSSPNFVLSHSLKASKWLSRTSVASAMPAVPVEGLLVSVLFLGEKMTVALAISLAAIITGMATAVMAPASQAR